MAVSRAQLVKELIPALDVLFKESYRKYMRPQYKTVFRYGKYSIYKTEMGEGGDVVTTTLAKGLSKEAADGMMKLLKEDDDE